MNKRFDPFLIPLAALVLMGAAFYNGFPLVYSDTGTYISSGFTLETPWDRPLLYGLFIRAFSLNGFSLWTVAFAQSLIISYLVFECFRSFTRVKRPAVVAFSTLSLLACFTGVSWVSSMLIADVFTPVCILSLLLILFARDLSLPKLIVLYVIAFLAIGMHISHVGMCLLFILLVLVRHFWRKRKNRSSVLQVRRAWIALVLPVLAIFTMGAAIGKARHIFLMARLSEMGIVEKYLDEHCGEKNFGLCKYRDSLPHDAGTFLWEPSSPLAKMGGRDAVKKEYNEIIHGIFTSPKYLGYYVYGCFTGTMRQALAVRCGEGLQAYDDSSTVSRAISKWVSREQNKYRFSQQEANNLLPIDHFNFCMLVFLALSVLVLVVWWLFAAEKPALLLDLSFALVAAIFVSYFSCAATATIAQRYGCRVIWLVPLFVVILFVNGELKKITQRR